MSLMVLKTVCVEPGSWHGRRRHARRRGPSCARSAPARARPPARPATRMILPFRCTVTVAASAELPPPTQSPSHAPDAKIAASTGHSEEHPVVMDAVQVAVGAAPGPDPRRDDRLRDRAPRAAATSSGSGSGRPGRARAARPAGTAAAASSLRDRHAADHHHGEKTQDQDQNGPVHHENPHCNEQSLDHVLPDPRRESTAFGRRRHPRERQVCATTGRAAMMAAPRAVHDSRSLRRGRRGRAFQGLAAHRRAHVHLRGGARARRAGGLGARRARGVRPGDLVLATARNTPEYLFAWLGTAYAGAIIVAVNPRAGETELAGLVRQVRPRLVVTDPTAPASGARVPAATTVDVAALYSRPAGPRRRRGPGPTTRPCSSRRRARRGGRSS